MEKRYDAEFLKKRASQLPEWKQIAFMLICCERMFPNYLLFARSAGWGDAQALRTALDAAWSVLEKSKGTWNFRALMLACERASPDTEDFTSEYTSAALDAAVATTLVVEALERFDPQKVTEVAQLAFDTVHMFAECASETSTTAVEQNAILEHLLVQAELRAQRESLGFLETIDNDQRVAVPDLKKRCRDVEENWAPCRGSLPG